MSTITPDTLPAAMTRAEIQSATSLASIFALRMLGLFLILPVFAIHAKTLPGGDSAFLVGLAMGIYGLTQSFGQIPFGAASDKYGRKPIIIIGLILFALGSFIAAAADSMLWMIIGRAVQGAGAISAAVTAFIADSTREEHRTKAMAMVGGSIGLTFAFSLVAAPLLYKVIGMGGIFALTGILSVLGILVVLYLVPAAPALPAARVPFSTVLRNGELMRLNYGVFALHLMQMAMFVVVPPTLVTYLDLPVAEQPGNRIDHRRESVFLQHRKRVFVEILVSIVKSQHHCARRNRHFSAQAAQCIVQTQHMVTAEFQVRHLRAKAPVVAIGGAMGVHRGEIADLVIHQNLDAVHALPFCASSRYTASVACAIVSTENCCS